MLTRQANLQSDWIVVHPQEGLDLQHDGTHAKHVFYGEGDILMKRDSDGNMVPDVENSSFDRVYWSKPDTQAIQSVFAEAAKYEAQRWETAYKMMGLAAGALGVSSPAPAPVEPSP